MDEEAQFNNIAESGTTELSVKLALYEWEADKNVTIVPETGLVSIEKDKQPLSVCVPQMNRVVKQNKTNTNSSHQKTQNFKPILIFCRCALFKVD